MDLARFEETGEDIVTTEAHRVLIVAPWKAAENDPTMSEWLRLPAADRCPLDPELHRNWGTRNPQGYLLVRRCSTCGTLFRPEVDAHTIEQVVGALRGTHRRFGLS